MLPRIRSRILRKMLCTLKASGRLLEMNIVLGSEGGFGEWNCSSSCMASGNTWWSNYNVRSLLGNITNRYTCQVVKLQSLAVFPGATALSICVLRPAQHLPPKRRNSGCARMLDHFLCFFSPRQSAWIISSHHASQNSPFDPSPSTARQTPTDFQSPGLKASMIPFVFLQLHKEPAHPAQSSRGPCLWESLNQSFQHKLCSLPLEALLLKLVGLWDVPKMARSQGVLHLLTEGLKRHWVMWELAVNTAGKPEVLFYFFHGMLEISHLKVFETWENNEWQFLGHLL